MSKNPNNRTQSISPNSTQAHVTDYNGNGSNSDTPIIDENEESARDDYINLLGTAIEQIQDELEAEIGIKNDLSICVDPARASEAIQTLSELLDVRATQLNEPKLPQHVDDAVEKYRRQNDY